ncbi:hypothetical protein K502DRAFT_366021 [Neoconidiobolus thromboides FSU 785]|nr:hypothetical protein K502DRAFT_366021 [Neoconidiobolus thromboides FSU 785]
MGSLFRMFKNYLSVNPTLLESSMKVGEFRIPPGSIETPYKQAPGEVSPKLSKNYYFTRDVRRNYPKTITYTQGEVALLLNQPAMKQIESNENKEVEESKEIKIGTLEENIAQLKLTVEDKDSLNAFLPPVPGKRYRYQISDEDYNMKPGTYWPIYLVK